MVTKRRALIVLEDAISAPLATIGTTLRRRSAADLIGLALAAVLALVLVLAVIRLVVAFRAQAPTLFGGAAGLAMVLLFAVGTILVAAAFGAAVHRAIAARRRADEMTALLAALDEPAAITALDGTIQRCNAAMAARGARVGQQIERPLAGALPGPDRTLFRVTRAAMLDGFGIEPLPDLPREDGSAARAPRKAPGYLVTQVIGPDTMLWRLGARLEGFERSGAQNERFAHAPFAHLTVAADGRIAANREFERLFGAGEAIAAEIAGIELPAEGHRVVLPVASGENVLVRSFVTDRGTGPARTREISLFPVSPLKGLRVGMSSALDTLPIAFAQLDMQGRILWMNAAARAQLGRQARLGMPFGSLVEGLGRTIAARIGQVAAGDDGARPEMAKTLHADTPTTVQVSLSRIAIDGLPSIIAVISDATELEDMKIQFVQSQKMEAVGKLAGGVAHDFNNVLTAIIGHCDLLLLRNEEGSRDHGDLTQIKLNANRAAQLVRQLLAFSRKQTMQPKLLSMRDVLADQIYLLQRLIGERVTLRVKHGSEDGHVRADAQQIEQALMNLVVNARDAMLPEGGEVLIATRNLRIDRPQARQDATVTPGDYVEIAVADEGPGIDAATIGSIFEPFFTTKAVGEGTGLGLSTVYGIVKQSGGFIFAENREPRGALFTILLPRVSAPERVPEAALPPPAADATGRGSILLVEDEAPVRSFAVRALKLRGYDVADSESADEALVLLADPDFRVDVLVSDVVMPGMDGPTFVKEARKLRPELKVVFISGYARDSFRKHLDDDDFLFLPKPFTLNELTLKVKEAIGR